MQSWLLPVPRVLVLSYFVDGCWQWVIPSCCGLVGKFNRSLCNRVLCISQKRPCRLTAIEQRTSLMNPSRRTNPKMKKRRLEKKKWLKHLRRTADWLRSHKYVVFSFLVYSHHPTEMWDFSLHYGEGKFFLFFFCCQQKLQYSLAVLNVSVTISKEGRRYIYRASSHYGEKRGTLNGLDWGEKRKGLKIVYVRQSGKNILV